MALAGPALLGSDEAGRLHPARSCVRAAGLPGWDLALGALAAAAALLVAGSLGFVPDNDGYARLARAVAAPPWLAFTQTKPLELLLAWGVARLPVEPLLAWRLLGSLHVGLCAALVLRIVARGLGAGSVAAGRPASVAWRGLACAAAASLAVSAPLFLEHALAMNSVATLGAALLLWVERGLAGSAPGRSAALALAALSRLDGLLLAGLLAAAPVVLPPAEAGGRWRSLLRDGAVVATAGVVWLATDRVANGRWLGFLVLAGAQFEILPPPRFDVPGMARWLRGAWLSHASECVLLLAGVGAALSAARPGSPLAAPARGLALALAAHHAVLALLGLTGRSLLYRYFVPDLLLGLCLAVLGFAALLRGLAPPSGALRVPCAAALALLAFGGALADVRELGDAAREVRARHGQAAAAERCLRPFLDGASAPELVVPSRLHGELTWRLRDAALGDLLYEEWFFAARAAATPGGRTDRLLWLGAADLTAPARAAGPGSRELARCEGEAAPLALRLLAPGA
jgi:hypothetical protein